MKATSFLLAAFLAASTSSLFAQQGEIIVESSPNGQNHAAFQKVDGAWLESTAKSKAPGLTGTAALYKSLVAGGAAKFAPEIPADGKYDVYVTYPDPGNASGVIYKVHSASGDREIVLDQNGRAPAADPAPNVWIPLGTFEFKRGADGFVEVRDPGTGKGAFAREPNTRIYADSVKFVPNSTGKEIAAAVNHPVDDAAVATAPSAPAAPSAVAAAPAAAPGMPPMPDLGAPPPPASAPPPSTGLPPLAAAAPPAPPGMPSLTAAAPPASQPNLVSGQSVTLPPLPAAASAAATPALPALQAAMPGQPAPPADVPGAAPVAPALPPLTADPAAPALPPLGAAPAAPALPPLNAPAAAAAASAAPPLPPLSGAPQPPTPPLSPLPGSGTAGTPPAPPPTAPPGTLPPIFAAPGAATPGATAPGMMTPTPAAATTETPAPPPPPAAPAPSPALAGMPAPPLGALPPIPGAGEAAPPMAPPPVAGVPGASDLSWVFDIGAAQTIAEKSNKPILVFFTAAGNKRQAKYESEFFTSPSVRSQLDRFVLMRSDFPTNTRYAYKLGVYGAGNIVVIDRIENVKLVVDEMPATPDDLAKKLESVK